MYVHNYYIIYPDHIYCYHIHQVASQPKYSIAIKLRCYIKLLRFEMSEWLTEYDSITLIDLLMQSIRMHIVAPSFNAHTVYDSFYIKIISEGTFIIYLFSHSIEYKSSPHGRLLCQKLA